MSSKPTPSIRSTPSVQRVALRREQVLRAQALIAILTATEIEQIVLARVQRLAEAARRQLEADPAPRAAALEHKQVAAVGIDVHQVRIERADTQPPPGRAALRFG
jgi:hypothetical protein